MPIWNHPLKEIEKLGRDCEEIYEKLSGIDKDRMQRYKDLQSQVRI